MCKNRYENIWITVLVFVMQNHHWNGETGINLFGQTERKRDTDIDKEFACLVHCAFLHKWTVKVKVCILEVLNRQQRVRFLLFWKKIQSSC